MKTFNKFVAEAVKHKVVNSSDDWEKHAADHGYEVHAYDAADKPHIKVKIAWKHDRRKDPHKAGMHTYDTKTSKMSGWINVREDVALTDHAFKTKHLKIRVAAAKEASNASLGWETI